MPKIRDIIEMTERFAPLDRQLDFDNCGLIFGYPERELKKALITLDCTPEVVAEAVEKGANLIIMHHPVLFTPIKKLNLSYSYQRAFAEAIKHDVSLYATHTSFDFADGGLNDRVASMLGAKEVTLSREGDCSSMRIGILENEETLKTMAEKAARVFNDKHVATVGDENTKVKTFAVINGGGGGSESAIMEAKAAGADIFITSDLKYNVVRLAKDLNYGIIYFGHYDSELPFVDMVKELFNKNGMAQYAEAAERCFNPYN